MPHAAGRFAVEIRHAMPPDRRVGAIVEHDRFVRPMALGKRPGGGLPGATSSTLPSGFVGNAHVFKRRSRPRRRQAHLHPQPYNAFSRTFTTRVRPLLAFVTNCVKTLLVSSMNCSMSARRWRVTCTA